MSDAAQLLIRLLRGGLRHPSTTSPLETSGPRENFGEFFGFQPKREAEKPADPDLAAADRLIAEVAERLDVADAEALRAADRDTRLRFAKRLRSQREFNADLAARAKAEADAAAAEAKAKEADRLAALGAALGKAERSK